MSHCRGGGVVIALASRSVTDTQGGSELERQVSQWACGLAGVRVPSPAPDFTAQSRYCGWSGRTVAGDNKVFPDVDEVNGFKACVSPVDIAYTG
jgi:hypothetical protein